MQVQGGVLDTHVRRRAVAGQAHAHPCQGAHPPAAASSCTSACSHLRHALPCMWHHAVATLFSEKVIEAVQWPAESRVTCQMDKKQPTPMHCLAKIPKALPGSAEPRAAAQMFKKVLKADWPRPARYSQLGAGLDARGQGGVGVQGAVGPGQRGAAGHAHARLHGAPRADLV